MWTAAVKQERSISTYGMVQQEEVWLWVLKQACYTYYTYLK